MVVHLILKTHKVECDVCKRVEECFMYKCEVDYRYNFEESFSEIEDISKGCETMIPLCRHCYHSDRVFVCEKHYYSVNTSYMCDYTYQSYNHSPVDYWCPEIGFRRVYDAKCIYCSDDFYTCRRHPRSPHKNTVCARCNITKLGGKFYKYLVGLRRKSKSKNNNNSSKNDIENKEKYIEKLNELEKPDEDGFVLYISNRQKRKIKETIYKQK